MVSINAFSASGHILTGASITKVSSTSGNSNAFWVEHKGGGGQCAATTIVFKESDAGHPDIFKRTYSAALTALTTGLKVNVYRYDGDDCHGVSIELYN